MIKTIDEVVEVFVNRDGMSRVDATNRLRSIMQSINRMLTEGKSEEVEDYWMDESGLEVDYLVPLLF